MALAVTVPTRSVQDDGCVLVVAEIHTADGLAQTVSVTVTPDLALTVLATRADGAPPLTGFEAWSA